MIHRLLLLLANICVCATVIAVPARRVKAKVQQPDGSLIMVTLVGDEHCHFYMTDDGMPVNLNEDGSYCYLMFNGSDITVSGILAHEEQERTKEEKKLCEAHKEVVKAKLTELATQRLTESNAEKAKSSHMGVTQLSGSPSVYEGNKRGLVILVEFPNLAMSSDNIQKEIQRMFSEKGYHENGHIGSVSDYFRDQSYGRLNIDFDVVGPVMAKENYGYYGRNGDKGEGGDVNLRQLIREACTAADKEVDFKDYDWDDDGEVDQVFVVYAGYGEHAYAPANTIWPQESILGTPLVLDGVKINTYACSSELSGNSGNTLSGIGVACHEFSHCLGLPDLYDTDYSGAFGMSYWDVMNTGSHSGPHGNAEVPYGYSAYERWFCGWIDIKEVEDIQHVTLGNLADYPETYMIRNGGNDDEYFIFENHQADRWYSYLSYLPAGHGMLITHINYNQKAWMMNMVNPTANMQRYTIIPADGNYGEDYDNLLGDIYPGPTNTTFLTNESHYDAGGKLYNENTDGTHNMNVLIFNIQEEDGVISFDIVKNDIMPKPLAELEKTDDGITIQWIGADRAESYDLSYSVVYSLMPLVIESKNIENITSMNYRIETKERDPLNVIFKIRANVGTKKTPWSESVNVKVNDVSAITETSIDKVYTLYSINGIKCTDRYRGVALIRDKNGVVRKIIK